MEKKGITTKVDVDLHAKARQYMSEHGDMKMEEFIEKAINGLINSKTTEDLQPEKMRTLAFQVPDSFYQQVKEYLSQRGLRQNRFIYNLIQQELERHAAEMERLAHKQNGGQCNGDENPEDGEDDSQFEREETFEGGEPEDEDESEGMAMQM